MKKFTHVHHSSRYDRSQDSLRRAMNNHIKRDGASIITLTEVEYEPRERVLRDIEGFGVVTGDISPRNDSGILYKREDWKLIAKGNKVIATKTYYNTGGSPTSPVAATWAILEHRVTGKRILVLVYHAPSSVQEGDGWSDLTRRVEAWWSALNGARKLWKELKKEHRFDGILLVADWNLDLKRDWVQNLFKKSLASFDLVWTNRYPAGGTHGNRLIDFSLIRGAIRRVKNPYLLPGDASSDHRPYAEVLGLDSK